MKDYVFIDVTGLTKVVNEIYEKTKDYCCDTQKYKSKNNGKGNFMAFFEKESPGIEKLVDECEKNYLQPPVTEYMEFTEEEIENCEYFEMILSCPLYYEGTCASDYGTKYTGGCPFCGLGKKRVGDIFVDRKYMKKRGFFTLRPDIVVSSEIKALIEAQQFSGVTFDGLVKDFKNREMDITFYGTEIQTVLPETDESTWFQIEKTYAGFSKCGHWRKYVRSPLKYNRHSLDNAKDFNLTCEYVDIEREREIIISKKVRDVFLQQKLKVLLIAIYIID